MAVRLILEVAFGTSIEYAKVFEENVLDQLPEDVVSDESDESVESATRVITIRYVLVVESCAVTTNVAVFVPTTRELNV